MFLDVLPFKNDTARLVRVYGDEPCITLPEALPAPEGGTLTITELGDYCFSEKPRGLPAPEELCRYAVEPDGTARLLRAFGRDLTGASHARYDLDFGDGDASTAARSGEEALHPLCGSFLEELVLPGSLRVIGSCAFYNCRRLRRLSAGAGELTMGSDVFLNCFALETLVIRARPEQATGLFALVACITEAVQALFWPEGEARPLAGLWYPAYWEDIEETPAHILLHTFSGQGYHYRQCFLDGKFLPVEYDAIFPQGHDADDANIMAMLCFDRLRWPWSLSSAAAEHYRAFLAANTGRVLARLLKAQDMDGLRALLALDVFDKDAFAAGAACLDPVRRRNVLDGKFFCFLLFFFFLYPLPVRDLVGKPGEIEHADIRHVVHIIHHLIDLARVLVHGIKALLHAVRADIDVSRKGNHLSGFALRSAAHEADFFIGIFCMMVRAFCFRLSFVRGTVHSVFLF